MRTQPVALAALFLASAFAQPIETRLGHVVIVVRDLKAAKLVYAGLGFSMGETLRPNGGQTGSEISVAGFSGDAFLELATPYDPTLPNGRQFAQLLKQGEGAKLAALRITSAEQAARDLNAAGLKVNGPG